MKVLLCSMEKAVRCQDYWHLFEENGIEMVETMATDPETVLKFAEGAHVIMSTVHRFDADLIARLDDSVRCIMRIAIGYDTIDVEAATKRGILVCNVPDYGTEEVAVHAFALLLASLRKVCLYNSLTQAGQWDQMGQLAGYPARRISTLTLGLLGFGAIARNVARYAAAFGMRVIASDPFVPDAAFEELGVEKVGQDELLAAADVVSLHLPLFAETEGMINRESIARMKDSAILINTARGGLVNEADLHEALTTGGLRAAALDVFQHEPLKADGSPLMGLDNVITTPHIAYQTDESYQDLQRKAVEIAIAAAKGEVPYSTVNRKALGL